MTTKRKLLITGIGSMICCIVAGAALVFCQISMVNSWGMQMQLLPFRPWTGQLATPWDALAQLFGYAVPLFLFAAIILALVFVRTFFEKSKTSKSEDCPA